MYARARQRCKLPLPLSINPSNIIVTSQCSPLSRSQLKKAKILVANSP